MITPPRAVLAVAHRVVTVTGVLIGMSSAHGGWRPAPAIASDPGESPVQLYFPIIRQHPPPIVAAVTRIGGALGAVAARDPYLYFGEGMFLVTMDVSRPEVPLEVDRRPLPGVVDQILLEGGWAYVRIRGRSTGWIDVFDLADPARPAPLGRLEASGATTVADGRVYVASTSVLTIYDLRDPRRPRVLGHSDHPFIFSGVTPYISDIAVTGGVAYLATSFGLYLMDVADPANIRHITSRDAGWSSHLGLAGKTVVGIVHGDRVTLSAWDASQARAPRELSAVPLCNAPDWSAGDLAVQGPFVYTVCYRRGNDVLLQVFDLTDPSHPRDIGRWSEIDPEGTYEWSIAVDAGRVYLADGNRHLFLLDVTRPEAPRRVGSRSVVVGRVQQIAAAGRHLAVLSDDNLVTVLDVADPSGARAVGAVRVSGAGEVHRLVGAGRHLYALGRWTDRPGGFLGVIDAGRPDSPREVSRWTTPDGLPMAAAVGGGFAYVAVFRTVVVLDLTDPTRPRVRHTVGLDGVIEDLALTESRLSVLIAGVGLRTLDVGSGAAPRPMGVLAMQPALWFPSVVAARGAHVYVASRSQDGVAVVDAGDPDRPRVLAMLAARPDYVDRVFLAADGDRLWHLGTDARLIDVSDPGRPAVVAGLDIELGTGLALVDKRVFVAEWEAGILGITLR